MKLKKQILVILSALFPLIMPAQVVKKSYTLDEVIQLALERSPDAMMAKHRLRGSYWRYKSHKASTLPYISLDATLPSYDRSVKYNIRDDGTYAFQDVNNITTGGDLSIRQYIGPTGTSIFLRSSLNRYAYLQDTSWVSSYFSNPIQLQVVQPIFKFNKFKWDRKIEPLHYNEAIQSYLQQREGVIIKAINVFFDLLAAQIEYQVNVANLKINKQIYEIAKGRYKIGIIAENELLQMELNLLNSEASVESNKLEYDNKKFRFRSFLKLNEGDNYELIAPKEIIAVEVDPEKAKNLAWENNARVMQIKRKELQALMAVDRAKKDNSIGLDLVANYGLSKDAPTLDGVYKNFKQSQMISLGVNVPILDWGQARGRIKMAESNLELTKLQLEQDKIDFEQNVLLQIKQFNMQKYQLRIAEKKDKVAEKSFEIAKERFIVGKIDNLNYNDAQTKKDASRIAYLNQLRNYWVKYYNVRKITLYDFKNNKPLIFEIEDILN